MTLATLRRALSIALALASCAPPLTPLEAQTKAPATQAQLDSLAAKLKAASSSLSSATTQLARMGAAKHDTVTLIWHDTVIVVKHDTVAATPAAPPVIAPTPPVVTPPIAPSSAGCPNEPAGYTTITDDGLSDVPRWPAMNSKGWIDDARNASSALSMVTDPTAPPGSVVAGLFPAGASGGSAPFSIYRPFTTGEQFKNLYLCLYVKHDANFDNTNGNAGTKFLWPSGDQVGGALTYTSHDGAAMDFQVIQQGPVDRQLTANLGASAQMLAKRGVWVRYELLLKANSSNATADGALDVWLDGVQTHHYTNVAWQMATSRTWLSLAWNPTYGGGSHPVPHDQRQSIDHLHVSGSNK